MNNPSSFLYNEEMALRELMEVKANVMEKVKRFLSERDYKAVAVTIVEMEHYIEVVESIAIELRLKGQLHYGVYRTFIEGLAKIIDSILKYVENCGPEAMEKVRFEYHRLKYQQV
ncbi:MAG: hypothetical protein DRP11_02000 [Candidatus Aenigmatarchaeota archaeon]|nr:MAG: hypothetical protein DRP11_02000 [Candidatus Aenigmarchaeota archaeon]